MTNTIIGGVDIGNERFSYQIEELKGLAHADNLTVVATVTQKLDHRHAGTYFGQGKLNEIQNLLTIGKAEVFVINDELSPTQIRNLEKILEVTIIDRTELILEIFEKRARTREAKIQVEIAKLQYEMPRIHPSSTRLDQQGGGGGGLHNRGAGETKSELNRRTIGKQISELKKQLKSVEIIHDTQSHNRKDSGIPLVSLVGYTNAGKSTTFNNLPSSLGVVEDQQKVMAADMLFATLDTTVRSLKLPDKREFLLSDTVGFIEGLPHQLVESFKTTLEEAKNADLLINVVDYSDPNCDEMIATTKKVLTDLKADDIPVINFYNKADLLPGASETIIKDNNIFGSALNPETLDQLGKLIIVNVFSKYQEVKLHIPFDNGEVSSEIMSNYPVKSCTYLEDGIQLVANLSPTARGRFKAYILN